jgi:hypothetical protein
MKQLIALVLLAGSVSAMAQPGFRHHHHHGYHSGHNYNWIAPTIIGGVIGYEIARNYPPVVIQQPVVVQQAPATVYYGQSQQCTAWTEVQNYDGTITRTRTCSQ